MCYAKEQISAALLLLKATGSPDKVIQTLGYPSNPKQKDWKQAPADLKQSVIRRCIIGGESVKSISEEIEYSPSLIYKWLKCYHEKGYTAHMKNTNVNVDPEDIASDKDIDTLKNQLLEMQMEIDILEEL